jgi:subtilase family serine protease
VNRASFQALPLFVILALAACSNGSSSQSLLPQAQTPTALATYARGDVPFVGVDPVRALCPTPGTAQEMQCFAMMRTDVQPTLQSDVSEGAETCPFTQGYCPVDLQKAYKLPSLTDGDGRTVAIVDAYGYSHAASDLAYFRKTMGLKACDTATKCLRIVNQNGDAGPLPGNNEDWDGEQSLDLDMVSGICPNCKILLVQAENDETNNLYTGVQTAGRLGAKYIGASWGGYPEGQDDPIFHQSGVVISAAAGDNGGGGRYHGGPIQPCTYTYVVCVGGTHLVQSDNKRGWSETVWNDWTFDYCGSGDSPCGATGSACSTKISKPSWQTDTGCKMRSAADVSATASLRAPVIVYNTQIGSCKPSSCFWLFGGTSASTQIISAVFALAGNAADQDGASTIWKHHTDTMINNVTVGNNLDLQLGVTCASSVKYICTARVGFSGPVGWGTPEGIGAF